MLWLLTHSWGQGRRASQPYGRGIGFIGIEMEEEYLTIAEGRIRHWNTREAGWNAAEGHVGFGNYQESPGRGSQ